MFSDIINVENINFTIKYANGDIIVYNIFEKNEKNLKSLKMEMVPEFYETPDNDYQLKSEIISITKEYN